MSSRFNSAGGDIGGEVESGELGSDAYASVSSLTRAWFEVREISREEGDPGSFLTEISSSDSSLGCGSLTIPTIAGGDPDEGTKEWRRVVMDKAGDRVARDLPSERA